MPRSPSEDKVYCHAHRLPASLFVKFRQPRIVVNGTHEVPCLRLGISLLFTNKGGDILHGNLIVDG
jgi:hypothetical protein